MTSPDSPVPSDVAERGQMAIAAIDWKPRNSEEEYYWRRAAAEKVYAALRPGDVLPGGLWVTDTHYSLNQLEESRARAARQAKEAMREKCAAWHDEQAEQAELTGTRQDVERHRIYATALRAIPAPGDPE